MAVGAALLFLLVPRARALTAHATRLQALRDWAVASEALPVRSALTSLEIGERSKRASALRAALDAALPATADLCGAGGGCVGILARDPPRRLPPGLPAELRALLPDLGVAEVAFPRRAPSPARQFAMMRAVDVLVAPHGAALANVPFLPKCAVVLEASEDARRF